MSRPPIFAFVWFTYELDHAILLRSVKAVRSHFPGAPLYIVDDVEGGKRLHKRVVQALGRMGCQFVPTTTPRRGNLRGWQCARMIANTFKWVQSTTGCEIVVKIDSDVLMLNPKWLHEFHGNKEATYAGMQSKCKRAVCGPTYALKKEAVDALWDSYQNDMESPYHTEEDFELSSRLWRHYGGSTPKMVKVPYSFAGSHPEWADARCGVFAWEQNILMWHRWIANNWEEVVFGRQLITQRPKDQNEAKFFAIENNRHKAAAMKRIWLENLKRIDAEAHAV